MRWTIVILVIALALIFDQLKFNGYYRLQTFHVTENLVGGILRLVR